MALHCIKATLERCKGWIEVSGGCWHIWGWIIVSFQTCTICMFGSGLEPSNSSHTELLGWWGWDPPDIQGFLWPITMAHILGPQPTWPCLINGFQRGHTLHSVQHAAHVPKNISIHCCILFLLLWGESFQHFSDSMYTRLQPFSQWTTGGKREVVLKSAKTELSWRSGPAVGQTPNTVNPTFPIMHMDCVFNESFLKSPTLSILPTHYIYTHYEKDYIVSLSTKGESAFGHYSAHFLCNGKNVIVAELQQCTMLSGVKSCNIYFEFYFTLWINTFR